MTRVEELVAMGNERRHRMTPAERAGYMYAMHYSDGDSKMDHFRYIENMLEFDVGEEVALRVMSAREAGSPIQDTSEDAVG